MSSAARAWLVHGRAAVPLSLAGVVETAVAAGRDDATDVVAEISAAGIVCLRTALRIGDDRAAALQLLAADALITAACAAAAGTERELERLATQFSAGRLATLFREELTAEPS